MLNWLNFFLLSFWALLLALALSAQSFFSLLLGAEALWGVLYTLAATASLLGDELGLLSLPFFLLGLAAAELALGLLLLVLMRYTNLSLDLGRPRALNG